MRNASGHQDKNERQWKKVNRNAYNIFSIKRVAMRFLEVSRSSRAKKKGKKYTKKEKVCCTFKVVFLLIRHTDFVRPFRFRRRLALHDLIFCLSKI